MSGAPGPILINELHYHPDVKTERVEFIELFHRGSNTVDLSGWQFSSGVQFVFPEGTQMAPGTFLVVAQDPAAVRAKFGVSALGPYSGVLAREGERVTLRNREGVVEDEVEYRLGFPWPTVGDPPGYSIELIHPEADNDLGGSWRASVAGDTASRSEALIVDNGVWRYFKGTSEPSDPVPAWRQPGYDDSGWASGPGPVGYGENFIRTRLDDMRGGYVSVYFRRTFTVDDPSAAGSLVLEALYDDGFKAWINGVAVLNANINSGEVPFNGTAGPARESLAYELFTLNSPGAYLRQGENTLAVQAHNSSISSSSDFFFDLRLRAEIGPARRGPTPGRVNSVYATGWPPQIRQVDHRPAQPRSGEAVTVQAKITDPDGVGAVWLDYQVVDPGNYIERSSGAYVSNWVAVAMNDRGVDGDEAAGDDVYTATLPAGLQRHRRLVRYRIAASDRAGQGVAAPYSSAEPNFAYFVYDGIPGWRGAVRPGATPAVEFSAQEMGRLPVYHLIARRQQIEEATWTSKYGGDLYRWQGTLVYDGEVYDHIRFRARGGVWRYAMGKNMWKFDFNRDHEFRARDNWGEKFKTTWRKLNLGACIQQGDYLHRGEQGMFESVGFRLFNLAGVASPETALVTFRIIDEAEESDLANQYAGDFWGLYLATEQEDGRFLEEHGLPDGNFYKMEGGTGELNNLGPFGPVDKSDLNQFMSRYRNQNPGEAWWRANFDLGGYYSYQAMVQGIHHYDICYGKNYFYYRHPATGIWSVHPWDLDLTWADNMYDAGCGGRDEFKDRVLARAPFDLEYRNRVREIRDLLFNSDQAWKLIDEYARLLRGPGSGPNILDADRSQWDYNPVMVNSSRVNLSKAGHGRFYRAAPTRDFAGMVNKMKNYVNSRGGLLDNLARDSVIPARPTIAYAGPAGNPANRLVLRASDYAGTHPFAAMEWRLGDVTPAAVQGDPENYEINAVWESGDLPVYQAEITVPASAVKVGRTYRARARFRDTTGRTSSWSLPVELSVGAADTAAALIDGLRVSEVMYNPPAGVEYEFVELRNTSAETALDLSGAAFTEGIEFVFPPGTALAPGGYLLVSRAADANALGAFRAQYRLGPEVAITGPYSGSLDNGGEQVTLRAAVGGATIVSFEYGDGRGWPAPADGAGHSLVPREEIDPWQNRGALNYGGNWRASRRIGGSPGGAEPPGSDPVLLNEVVAHTDFTGESDSNDWIELFNSGTGDFVFGPGWFLSDDLAALRKWEIPAATVLPGRGWVTFDEVTGFHNPTNIGFGLNKAGEAVFLSYLPGTAEDRVVDSVRFEAEENGWSSGRYPDGGAFWYALDRRSRGGANAPPPIPVVISELMYHPPDLDGTNDNAQAEFVELWNAGPLPVSLAGPDGSWRLGGGIDFTFPATATLPPDGRTLVVNFDPADGAALQRFRDTYGLADEPIVVQGPYAGRLGNASDRVALERPLPPDAAGEPVVWALVDEVIYADQVPWPAAADGGGMALVRGAAGRSGNDPANWLAAPPTPGRADSASADSDGDGMPDSWERAHGLDPENPADAGADPDGDGRTNRDEFASGTNPRDALSVFKVDQVIVGSQRVTLRWTAVAGHSYSVLYRDDLFTGGWLKLKDTPPPSETRTAEVTEVIPPGPRPRYYRLVTPALP